MKTAAELRAAYEAKVNEWKSYLDKIEPTAEDVTKAQELKTQVEQAKKDLEARLEFDNSQAAFKAHQDFLNKPANNLPQPGGEGNEAKTGIKAWSMPAESLRGNAKHIMSVGYPREDATKLAYGFGKWLRACMGFQKDVTWCDEKGYGIKALDANNNVFSVKTSQAEGVNSLGGFLVPEEFENMLILLREQYGVFRQLVRVLPMGSDTKNVPRQTGNLTTYWVDENTAITESNITLDMVKLVAKKLACLATWSSELGEDALIDMGDKLAMEIAYAFAKTEDDTGFNGDGTSTYAGIQGVRTKLTNLGGTLANIAGGLVQTGTGTYSTTLADYQKLIGKLPLYADTPNACWIMHKTVWASGPYIAELAAGGVTSPEIINGVNRRSFLGYPVHFSQIMPSAYAANQFFALLGDLSLAAKMGDRRQTTIAFSEHANFTKDQLTIRGTERFDIVVHDVGNYSATASARVPGPIVVMITGTS